MNHKLFKEHENIIINVLNERQRQDDKFGKNRKQHPLLWNAILGEEKGEVDKAILEWHFEGKSLKNYKKELEEVAAVAIAALLDLEQNGIPEK